MVSENGGKLLVMISTLMLSERRVRQVLKYLFFYAVCYVAEFPAVEYLSTTSVSEFVASMERMHITDKIVIPLSVIFRFFPTIGEEYRAIADAMSMRQIRVGGKKPLKMIEYRIIPLMVSVVKIGDELSAAALTRGLGAPVKGTNICKIGFHWQDILLILFSVLCLSVYLVQVLR